MAVRQAPGGNALARWSHDRYRLLRLLDGGCAEDVIVADAFPKSARRRLGAKRNLSAIRHDFRCVGPATCRSLIIVNREAARNRMGSGVRQRP
jgi:hypothetical protein